MTYVMIAVPAELVPRIAQLVAEYTGDSMVFDGPDRPEVNEDPVKPKAPGARWRWRRTIGWTAEGVRRYYAESTEKQRGVLNYLAANPGIWIGSLDIAANVAEIEFSSVPGVFSELPVGASATATASFQWQKDSKGHWVNRMPAAVADVIKQAAAVAPGSAS